MYTPTLIFVSVGILLSIVSDCLCPKKLVPSLLTLLMFCMGVLVVATTNGTVVMNKPRLSSLLQLLRFKRLFDEG